MWTRFYVFCFDPVYLGDDSFCAERRLFSEEMNDRFLTHKLSDVHYSQGKYVEVFRLGI